MSIEHITTQKAMQRHIGIQKKKKLPDVESTSSNALGWIVLDLDILVRFGFNYGIGFKINFVLIILYQIWVKLVFGICLWCL